MNETGPAIWIATSDGRNMIRADAIVVVRVDGGRVTAQLHDEAKVTVTLVDASAGPHPPDDFHHDLVRLIAGLADVGEARLVRPLCGERGWRWTLEPLLDRAAGLGLNADAAFPPIPARMEKWDGVIENNKMSDSTICVSLTPENVIDAANMAQKHW